MKTSDAMLDYVLWRIEEVYYRPGLMFGGTVFGVEIATIYAMETALYHHHEMWAFLQEKREQFFLTYGRALSSTRTRYSCFASRFMELCSDTDSGDVGECQDRNEPMLTYVLAEWKKISSDLGLPLSIEHMRRTAEQYRARLSAD